MVWRYVEKELKNSLYSSSIYWSPSLPKFIKRSIYFKYNLNVQFKLIPELWNSLLYYWYFNKYKNHYYPCVNNIKFFYFTLFKKNGFLFLISCCIIYKNYFLELVILITKSFILVYLILHFIYLMLFIRKLVYICLKNKKFYSLKYFLIIFLIMLNNFINVLFLNKKKRWYF